MTECELHSPPVKLLYVGTLKDGKYHGKGTLFGEHGLPKYIGDFQHGSCHGTGKVFDKYGVLMYDGEMHLNKYHGRGKCYDEIGKLRYEGHLKNNQFHGLGTLFDKNGKVIFSGTFKSHEMREFDEQSKKSNVKKRARSHRGDNQSLRKRKIMTKDDELKALLLCD